MIMLRADQGVSDLVENRVPDLPVGCVKAIEAGESNDLEAENADSRLLGGILELKAPSRESVPAHQPLSLRRNFGQSPAIVAIRIRSGSSQQTIRNVVASVLRGDQGALGPETREDALDPALTVRDQDLVIRRNWALSWSRLRVTRFLLSASFRARRSHGTRYSPPSVPTISAF